MALTEDQQNFADMVQRFLADKSQPTEVRRLMDTDSGYDPVVWKQLCSEVGLTGTHLPEAFGGYGFGPVELGIACERMGHHLYCGPFMASAVMAGYALLFAGDDAARERLLPALASGSVIASLVAPDLNNLTAPATTIAATDGVLTGAAPIVLDAQNAQLLVVIAGDPANPGLYTLPADAEGVSIKPLETVDWTRKLARVEFEGAAAEPAGNLSAESLGKLWDHCCVALSHEMIGGAQRLFETTVDYTKVRYQFGRPIGSFQALKHRSADLLMELEFAKAATYHAAQCLSNGTGEPWAASMAKALASDTYSEAARAAIQLRGGIGFTWEEDTHLWFKRAKSSEVLLGGPHIHRERMMTMMEQLEAAS